MPLPENHLGEDRLLQPAEAERCQSAPPAAVRDLVLRQQIQEGDRLQVVPARARGDPAGGGRSARLCTDSQLNPVVRHGLTFFSPKTHMGSLGCIDTLPPHFKIHSGVRA